MRFSMSDPDRVIRQALTGTIATVDASLGRAFHFLRRLRRKDRYRGGKLTRRPSRAVASAFRAHSFHARPRFAFRRAVMTRRRYGKGTKRFRARGGPRVHRRRALRGGGGIRRPALGRADGAPVARRGPRLRGGHPPDVLPGLLRHDGPARQEPP